MTIQLQIPQNNIHVTHDQRVELAAQTATPAQLQFPSKPFFHSPNALEVSIGSVDGKQAADWSSRSCRAGRLPCQGPEGEDSVFYLLEDDFALFVVAICLWSSAQRFSVHVVHEKIASAVVDKASMDIRQPDSPVRVFCDEFMAAASRWAMSNPTFTTAVLATLETLESSLGDAA